MFTYYFLAYISSLLLACCTLEILFAEVVELADTLP